MAKKKYQSGGLDENNLPQGSSPSNSAFDYLNTGGSSLPIVETLENLRNVRNPIKNLGRRGMGSHAAQGAQTAEIAQDPRIFQEGLEAKGYLSPESNPELYKTVWQSDFTNAWNTLFNEMRTMRKGEVEYELAQIRMKIAEYEQAKERADAFYAEGLVSKTDHNQILNQIEEGHLRGTDDGENVVEQLIETVM